MDFHLQNEHLQVRVDTMGAELRSVFNKQTSWEMIWQADPAVWNRSAPLLFPYCGRLFDDVLKVGGKEYPAMQHGFARDMPFSLAKQTEQELELLLQADDETRQYYPFAFSLAVNYRLQAVVLTQTVRVHNPGQADGGPLPFSVGFHPGFALPLEPGGATQDYEIRFDEEESPLEVKTPDGFVSGETAPVFAQSSTLPLRDDLFANGSICMKGLRSSCMTLQRKDKPDGEGPGVRVRIDGYPYTLLWSVPQAPMPFVCIEPWHGLPDGPQKYEDFTQKPQIITLAGGETFETVLEMQFMG